MFGFIFRRYRHRPAWNKGKIVGQKPPLELKEIWAIRIRLQMNGEKRGLALFNLSLDSKLRASDLLTLKVRDICRSGRVVKRATILQRKTRYLGIEIDDALEMAEKTDL